MSYIISVDVMMKGAWYWVVSPVIYFSPFPADSVLLLQNVTPNDPTAVCHSV